jgi:predicted DNA-binding transcriptional regulator AlpA
MAEQTGGALIRSAEVGEIIGVSQALWYRWRKRGRAPEPSVPRGEGGPLWRRAEIEAWALAGCPHARSWYWSPEGSR